WRARWPIGLPGPAPMMLVAATMSRSPMAGLVIALSWPGMVRVYVPAGTRMVDPGAPLAAMMASRKEQSPGAHAPGGGSSDLVTVNVAACTWATMATTGRIDAIAHNSCRALAPARGIDLLGMAVTSCVR